jgi:PKD repeat protein
VIEFNNTSTPGCTYLWDFGAGFTSTEANPSHDFLYDNTWPVQLIVTNDCGSDTLDTTVVVIKTSIADIQASNLSISEQAGTLTIKSNKPFEKGTLLILNNLSGQLLDNKIQAASNQTSIQLSTQQLSAGIYFITLQSSSNQVTLKWLKTTNY